MTLQYTTIDESSFAYGIDARSAENQIKAGFVRDLVNADIIEGRVRKRKGFTGYAGELPLRVAQYKTIDGSPDKLAFVFDGSVDIARVESTPILVYGRSTLASGPFSNAANTAHYFTSWTGNVRKEYLAGATAIVSGTQTSVTTLNVVSTTGFTASGTFTYNSTAYTYTGITGTSFTGVSPSISAVDGTTVIASGTVTAPATEHGITTDQMFVGIAEATDPRPTVLSSSEILEGDNVSYNAQINKSTKDITVGYTNGNLDPIPTFLYYLDQTSVSTINYVTSFTVSANTTTNPPITIDAPTHQLQSYNIIYQLWQDVGTSYVKVRPDEFSVDDNDGTVRITVTNATSASVTYRLILSVVPATNNGDYNITQGTNTLAITGITSPFIFYTLYLVSGNTLTEVLPDSYVFDDVANTWSVTFENNTSGALTARVYYTYGTVRANEIQVTSPSTIAVSETDNAPQLTVYGLSQASIYGNAKQVNRRGWVNHIDSYRSPVKTHVVSGLGGNLFSALTISEMPAAFAATMPTYFPRLNSRLASATKIGPAFWETGEAPLLDRGSLAFTGGGTNWATVTGVSYQASGTYAGKTKYTLSLPALIKTGNPITASQDYLTVKGMSHSRHNGEFLVVHVDYGTATADVYVTNSELVSTDYDDSGTAGLAGVFTDTITTTLPSPFLAGDVLLSSYWDGEVNLAVVGTSGSTTTIRNVYDYFSLGSGLVITGQRTSATIPLRTVLNVPSVTNLVVGDTIFYSGLTRPLQVIAVDTGNSAVTLDEAITWYDSLSAPPSLTVPQRWLPAESPQPDSGDNLLPTTTVRHLSSNPYDNQPFLRSVMVQNNMYLTNGSDEVYKYDGTSFYRAGIIPWQPGLFLTVQKVVADGLALAGTSIGGISGSDFLGKSIKLTAVQASAFKVNDKLQAIFTNGTNTKTLYLTVASITQETSGTNWYIYFTEPVNVGFSMAGGTITLTLVYQARYAFRLNVKDVNGVTIASAVTGAEDFVVQAIPTTTEYMVMRLRLVGLPAWDQYDFSNKNIELQVYRTLWSTGSSGEVPVFYRIATQACTFRTNNGYIDITDTLSNDTLTDVDPVVSVLSPDTVPAGWDEPARAKYITSAGNRLVLANIQDWPTLAVSYLTSAAVPANDFAGQKFLFRRSTSDTGVTTDVVNRFGYELRLASQGIDCHPALSGGAGQFKVVLNSLPSGLTAGDWVYLYHQNPTQGWTGTFTAATNDTFTVTSTAGVAGLAVNDLIYFSAPATGSLPTTSTGLLSTTKGYYIKTIGTNTFTISETYGGPTVDITVAGAGGATSAGSILEYCGWWQINSVDVPNLTVTIKDINSNITTTPLQFPDRALFASDPTDVPVLIDTDGNMGQANGNGPVPYNNILRRVGMAINTTMRVVDTTLLNYAAFKPWMVARSESDTQSQLIVKQPRAEVETPTLQIIYAANNYTTYVNGSKVGAYTVTTGSGTGVSIVNVGTTINFPASGSFTLDGSGVVYAYTGTTGTSLTGISPSVTYTNGQIIIPAPTPALTTRYPSRLLVSYNNYPEIFDNPYTVNDDLSDSAIDINSSDGQEITGVIPFFGESAFGAALQSGVIVVFKQNSIYLVDLAEKKSGRNPVQRLETQGLGCTAPYSIAPTKDGIAFANDSGIYVLRRNQRIEYLGRFVERLWQNSVDRNSLDLVQGHHYNVGRQYKLSVPLSSESLPAYAENSEVYVYNHTNEGAEETGGWGRYTNHPATGWANLFQDAFYATVNGSVQRLRAEGIPEDYRDGNSAIEAVLTTRAIDFGQAGIRKVVSHVVVNYRTGGTSEATTVAVSPDLHTDFDTTTAFTIVNYPANDGISSLAGQDIRTIRHSLTRRRCVYMTVRISNNGLDNDLEIAGMSFVVSGLNSKGIVQAASTKK